MTIIKIFIHASVLPVFHVILQFSQAVVAEKYIFIQRRDIIITDNLTSTKIYQDEEAKNYFCRCENGSFDVFVHSAFRQEQHLQ
jgi:hypothetical protein